MGYPKLDTVKQCVKCLYETRSHLWMIEYHVETEICNATGETCVMEDYLIRTCPRCSYRWKERCADAG